MSQIGKVALVTGASGKGMGRSIALTLSRNGIAVVVNYLQHRDAAEAVVSTIRARGGEAAAAQGDVFLKEDCKRLVQTAIQTYGKVDICVIGPGANWNPENLTDLKQDLALQDVMREVSPLYNLMPLLLKDMGKRKWGRIVGIASNMDIPSPSYSYNAAKYGRIDALRLAVNEAWKLGVTVNTIAPGPIRECGSLEEACTHCYDANTPRQGIVPQDVAEGVAFLCSEVADYITGCVLPYRF